MYKLGCLARYFNLYQEEVNFAINNDFDFMQIWYDNKGLYINKVRNEDVHNITNINFPSIIHAVLDINDFKEHIPILKDILKNIKHKELIIHPICESETINNKSIKKLNEQIKYTLEFLGDEVTVYLENNSKLDPIFQNKEEIEYIFNQNPKLEFLLDIAHIESYEHLESLIKIKHPKILHIADKHFNVIHEHLPIGKGELDYAKIFNEYLNIFEGKIVLEVFQSDNEIIESKNIIKSILSKIYK